MKNNKFKLGSLIRYRTYPGIVIRFDIKGYEVYWFSSGATVSYTKLENYLSVINE